MTSCGCKATISPSDSRAGIWKEVFGELRFPVLWPLYISIEAFPGKRFLQGDSSALTTEQKATLATLMQVKFGVPKEEVLQNLKDGPIPILDENVGVSFCRLHSRMIL